MSTLKTEQPVYQMTDQEKRNVFDFLEEVKRCLQGESYEKFASLIKHLCVIQDPFNRKYPFNDSIIHGIEAARICMQKDPEISEILLLASVGHDWDRACGDKRIKSTSYPNTEEGYMLYKKEHSKNSANLFCLELKKFYPQDVVERVRYLVLNHEFGGEGDLATLDFADSMVFFTYDPANYFRNARIYKGADGNELPPNEQEIERKKGFITKVKFTTETMSAEDIDYLKNHLRAIRSKMDSVVMKDLDTLLNL